MPRTHSDFGFIHIFDERVSEYPSAIYATYEDDQLSFQSLKNGTLRWQQFFADRGLKQGDRVGLMLTNSFDAITLVFALLRAGLIWVPINTQLRGPNLEHLISHSRPKVLIVEAELYEALSASIPESTLTIQRSSPTHFSVELPPTAAAKPPKTLPTSDVAAALMYTSGTTGPPKGVIVSHAMLRIAAEAALTTSEGRDGDVFFYWESMGHVGGAQVLLFPLLRSIQLAMVARFSASQFWDQVRLTGATQIHYLGGILQMLLNQKETSRDRDHSVRIAWGGGCTREVFHAFQKRFDIPLRECYGMTEASSIVTVADGKTPGSVGRTLPWIQLSILQKNGHNALQGKPGEIVLETSRPEAFFSGYFQNTSATHKALRNGRLHTGDLGRLDHAGNLFYEGRLTESLRCRGENVSAWEVEHVVMAHPSIEAAAVIGVDAEVGEQDIMVFIEFNVNAVPTNEEIVMWLTPKLAKYQLPRYFKTVDSFERTPSQRIKKHQLDTEISSGWDRLRQ